MKIDDPDKFIGDVYMTKEDLKVPIHKILDGEDLNWIQQIALDMEKAQPGYLTPERKKSLGLD